MYGGEEDVGGGGVRSNSGVSVMDGDQAAGVLAQITRERRAREGKPLCMLGRGGG